jgi:GNAT superfamily N-acetyltransferase
MNVRRARTTDLPRLIELGRAMREESLVYFPEVDARHTLEMWEAGLSLPDTFACFVAEDERVVGFLTACISTFFFSPEKFAQHDIFYVSPEARGSSAARRLVKAYEDWAGEHANHAIIRLDTNLKPEKIDKFYQRLGFEPMGGMYMKWLQ